ncbi:hypothetical protein Tco_0713047 [Tanacetum coccineum]
MAEETPPTIPLSTSNEGPCGSDPKEPPVGANTSDPAIEDHTPDRSLENTSGDPGMQFVVQNFEQINVMYSTFPSKRKEVNPTSAYNNDDHPVIEPWRSDSEETQKDVRNLVASHFTARIRDYDMPDGLKVPTNLKTYDGMSDPDDHLTVFMGTIDVHKLPEPAWCRFFHITLSGVAQFWYDNLLLGSINSFHELNELLRDYLGRFGKETLHMTDRSDGMMTGAFISRLHPGSWTTAYKNNIVQVNAEQGFEAMAGVKPSYASNVYGKHHFSGTQHINIAQGSGVSSEVQGYAGYPNDVPQLNPTQLPFNESSSGSSAYYQIRVKELTSSLYQTEGMLTTTQAMNKSIQTTVNSLRSENESLKSYHTMSCVGYNNLFRDLTRANKLEAIPRMLAKVLRSEQFDNKMLKVQKVLIDHLPRKAKDVVKGLKKIKWEYMETVLSSPDLSPNLLRGVLERDDSVTDEGSSSWHVV